MSSKNFDRSSPKKLTYRLILKIKVLYEDTYQVVGVMTGDECPADDFISNDDANTISMRQGLSKMLEFVAENGLTKMPSVWSHEANKKAGSYQFIKGSLRLFYFKGEGNQIAVCTTGALKKGQKADKNAINRAVAAKVAYFEAINTGTCEVIKQ